MAELRRLLIDPGRLEDLKSAETPLILNQDERHYLRRVLRKRHGDSIAVVDGRGHLWRAELVQGDALRLEGDVWHPLAAVPRPTPRLGLAVALVKSGTNEWLRMATELGVDVLQPLQADRCTVQAELRPNRWQSVVREATEQCERLWMPELSKVLPVNHWDPGDCVRVGIAVARSCRAMSMDSWLRNAHDSRETWLVVGPEGGWTDQEIERALRMQWQPVSMGESILRSSTAAICAAVSLVRWRSLSF